MTYYTTVLVTDRSGAPEYYAEVTAYRRGGSIDTKRTDREGHCEFVLEVDRNEEVSFAARVDGRRGETDWMSPSASVRVVVS